LGRPAPGAESSFGTWTPPVEVAFRDNKLEVSAELPGVSDKDVKVEVNNDNLIIQGERKYEHEDKEGKVRRSERRYGQFYRAIGLPEGAEIVKTRAEFKDGVLHVSIPVSQEKSNVGKFPSRLPALSKKRPE
jgi:HSP20 family protein